MKHVIQIRGLTSAQALAIINQLQEAKLITEENEDVTFTITTEDQVLTTTRSQRQPEPNRKKPDGTIDPVHNTDEPQPKPARGTRVSFRPQ